MADLAAIDDAIAALEAQRGLLGDAVVDTAIAPLRAQRDELVGRAVAEQRKLVTVLFSDLVDFTVLSQQLDAEDVRTVIDAYFVRWNEHIEANGGVVEKFIGDAVMAVFGLHQAEEEDPHRAIRAALSMRSSLDELNAEVGAAYDVTLEMRVGIDTGEVVVSTLGDRPGQEFVVVGEIVNRAARLQSAAPRGGVLISADTYRHVRGLVRRAAETGLQLKGIAEPVDGYLIQCERPRGFHLDGGRGVEGVDTRTVGRELELRQLQDRFYEVAEERQWQMVTVVGDAGVGKSRLLSDFDRWLDDLPEDGVVVRRTSRPLRPEPPLRPAPRPVRHPLRHPRQRRARPRSGASGSAGSSRRSATEPDVVDKAHVIGSWLGFEIGESRSLTGIGNDPQSLSGRATTHLGEYFRRLADQDPVVLLLEDLHWADEATLALINAADAVLRDSPVLVVATTRPTLLDRHPHWGEGLDFHTLPAAPVVVAARHPAAARRDPQARRARPPGAQRPRRDGVGGQPVLRRGAGELVHRGRRDHHGRRRLARARGAPRAGGGPRHPAQRAAGPPRRAAARRASGAAAGVGDRSGLLGRRRRVAAARPATRRSTSVDVPTDDALDRLRGRDLVYQREKSTFDHTREFLFKHALLRDVAYEGMLRRHRRNYHRLAASWFEQMAETLAAGRRVRRADRRPLRQRRRS